MSTGVQLILAVCLLCPLSFAALQRRQNTTVDSAGEFTNPTNFTLPNPSTASSKIYNADGTFNVTTGYISYTQCDDAQSAALWQAVNDAVSLAARTYDHGHDELKKRDAGAFAQFTDFSTQAAIEYFGPPSRSGPYQKNIYDTFKKASLAYPGWGVGDWFSSRYVILSCRDAEKQCDSPGPDGGIVAAYYSPNDKYPAVHFCKAYFTELPPHSVALNAMKKNKLLQNDVSYLRSQASTMLHEWLHIDWDDAAVICSQGCTDQYLLIGVPKAPQKVVTYKAGRAKLLAQIIVYGTPTRGADLASKNNDNFVYFSLAVLMYNKFGFYPQYPLAWLEYLTKEENIAREKQLGTLVDPLDAIVSDPADPVTVATPDGVLPASDYPAAYISNIAIDREPPTTTSTTSSTASSFIATPIQSSPPFATPSNAIIIYRRDVCEQEKGGDPCSSFAMEYNITPGQTVDTCTLAADYTQDLKEYLAGDTKDYSISVGPFTPHGLTACEYAGTNDKVGIVTCSNDFVQACSLPASTEAVKCGIATDTPIVYAEW